MILKIITLILLLSSLIYQSTNGARDWQNCRQKSMYWCTQMCGLTRSGDVGHGTCTITGFCLCPPPVIPPPFCKEASTYDYHEIFNCHRLHRLCSFGLMFPLNSTSPRPYVCTDEHQKKTSLEERAMKYCVCFHK